MSFAVDLKAADIFISIESSFAIPLSKDSPSMEKQRRGQRIMGKVKGELKVLAVPHIQGKNILPFVFWSLKFSPSWQWKVTLFDPWEKYLQKYWNVCGKMHNLASKQTI
jgi:hypothetical protein